MKLFYQDAQAMAFKHPDTFEAPSRAELSKIKEGDFVKVCISEGGFDGSFERPWTKVTAVNGNTIAATLANVPFYLESIEFDDPMTFEMRHVYSIQEAT